LPDAFNGPNSCAEIQIHPSGKYVYASNRGHDSVAVFAVNKKNGFLERRGHAPTGGKTPRFFGLDSGGRHLLAANQGSDTVMVFRIDQKTGLPQPTGESLAVSSPVCLVFAR
jgi:6-phosphogluconolactonase